MYIGGPICKWEMLYVYITYRTSYIHIASSIYIQCFKAREQIFKIFYIFYSKCLHTQLITMKLCQDEKVSVRSFVK